MHSGVHRLVNPLKRVAPFPEEEGGCTLLAESTPGIEPAALRREGVEKDMELASGPCIQSFPTSDMLVNQLAINRVWFMSTTIEINNLPFEEAAEVASFSY